VPLASALGEHADPRLALALPPSQRLVVPGASHWDLLDRAEVTAQLMRWLAR
jgi:pimeloyl-ACP methyl ester carboxylesterase